LPTVPELRRLWSVMVTEIAESGKVLEFAAPVELSDGVTKVLDVVRVGVFNAVSGGAFLDWDIHRSRENFIELARQPAGRYAGMAEDLQGARPDEVVPMAVDFTRGQILRAVVQTKTPLERVREDGGPVGYVIIAVGSLGLALCLWKFFALAAMRARVRRQLEKPETAAPNPLGRVLAVYLDHPEVDI